MKQILYLFIAFNIEAFGQITTPRDFFPEMKTEQTFVFEPDYSGCFAGLGKKIDSTRITIYFSKAPFIRKAGINYYLFTISDTVTNTYVDTFLLSSKNDTLSVSALKVSRLTESGRAKLSLKNVVTIPIIDFKNFRTVQSKTATPCYLEFFRESLSIENESIIKQVDESTFTMKIDYISNFGHVFRKIYFSTLKGIYKIDYY